MNASSFFQDLKRDQEFIDVTLACGDGQKVEACKTKFGLCWKSCIPDKASPKHHILYHWELKVIFLREMCNDSVNTKQAAQGRKRAKKSNMNMALLRLFLPNNQMSWVQIRGRVGSADKFNDGSCMCKMCDKIFQNQPNSLLQIWNKYIYLLFMVFMVMYVQGT